MKLVTSQGKVQSLESAAETLAKIEKDILDGTIVAFAMVGIKNNDDCLLYTDSVIPVSRLRMLGAIWHMLHCYSNA